MQGLHSDPYTCTKSTTDFSFQICLHGFFIIYFKRQMINGQHFKKKKKHKKQTCLICHYRKPPQSTGFTTNKNAREKSGYVFFLFFNIFKNIWKWNVMHLYSFCMCIVTVYLLDIFYSAFKMHELILNSLLHVLVNISSVEKIINIQYCNLFFILGGVNLVC